MASASGRFGVSSVASGSSFWINESQASGCSKGYPLLEIITGSTTITGGFHFRNPSAMARILSLRDTIPIFTPSTRISLNTASICAVIISGVISCTIVTPQVFCAVTAVITLMPNTPWAAKVFRSAWMPAPPLLSLPAIERRCFIYSYPFRRLQESAQPVSTT